MRYTEIYRYIYIHIYIQIYIYTEIYRYEIYRDDMRLLRCQGGNNSLKNILNRSSTFRALGWDVGLLAFARNAELSDEVLEMSQFLHS